MSPIRPWLDLVDRVVVQNAVMPLMADRQDEAAFPSRDAGHLLALGDVVRHQLLGQHVLALAHRGDRRLVVQVQAAGR